MADTEWQLCLPKFDYLSQKNSYSGSRNEFRYKVFPVKKDEIETVITAAVYRDNCFEVEDAAGRTEKKEFEYSPDGITAAENWLMQRQRELYGS